MPGGTDQRPLTARSLILSTLLGTHPPELPGRLLVRLAVEFGIAEGTARVALSRLVAGGELTNRDGVYALGDEHRLRQARQDRTRAAPDTGPWNGDWEQATIRPGARPAADRALSRRALSALKLAEFRDGVWLRPLNLDPERLVEQRSHLDSSVWWFTVRPERPAELAGELWDLDAWADRARALVDHMAETSSLAQGFQLAAAVLRHLLQDPEVPCELQPPGWPDQRLRTAYDAFDQALRADLSAFFRAQGGWKGR